MFKRENGFTLIELLVVIAILGVIAAVVSLNVSNFFGRGEVEAANIELHQVQTAIIAAMAECEGPGLNMSDESVWWVGQPNTILADCERVDGSNDASFYTYGPLRAAYEINHWGEVVGASIDKVAHPEIGNPWSGLHFCNEVWQIEPCE